MPVRERKLFELKNNVVSTPKSRNWLWNHVDWILEEKGIEKKESRGISEEPSKGTEQVTSVLREEGSSISEWDYDTKIPNEDSYES